MDFFKIIHLLLISPAHMVYEVKMSTVKKLLLKLSVTLVFVVVLVSLFNTYKSLSVLPVHFSEMFPGTVIENGELKTDTSYSIHAWQMGKINSVVSGMPSSVDTIGGVAAEVSMALDTSSEVPIKIFKEGIVAEKNQFLLPAKLVPDTMSWEYLLGSKDPSFDFSEGAFRKRFIGLIPVIFIFSFVSNVVSVLFLSLYLYILLGVVFFFSSLRGVISREERARMILISLLPIYILLPLFVTAGAGWDYFLPACSILSSIILGRALSFRRKTEFAGDENE